MLPAICNSLLSDTTLSLFCHLHANQLVNFIQVRFCYIDLLGLNTQGLLNGKVAEMGLQILDDPIIYWLDVGCYI